MLVRLLSFPTPVCKSRRTIEVGHRLNYNYALPNACPVALSVCSYWYATTGFRLRPVSHTMQISDVLLLAGAKLHSCHGSHAASLLLLGLFADHSPSSHWNQLVFLQELLPPHNDGTHYPEHTAPHRLTFNSNTYAASSSSASTLQRTSLTSSSSSPTQDQLLQYRSG